MANLVPYSKSSITKYTKPSSSLDTYKFLNKKTRTETSSPNNNYKTPKSNDRCLKILERTIKDIEKKVIKVDKLLKSSLISSKKTYVKKRIKNEQKRFDDAEKDLEKKTKKETKAELPSLPKTGIFDWIKNFITNVVLGFVLVRLINFLPQLLKLLPTIMKVGEFIIDVGGKVLDSLVTMIDWGYKAYDATRGFVKNIFGEEGVKKFDQLSGMLNKFLNLVIIAGMVVTKVAGNKLMSMAGDFIRKKVGDLIAKKIASTAVTQVTGATAGGATAGGATAGATGAAGSAAAGGAAVGGIGVLATAGIITGVGLIASALGEGAFQIKKITKGFEKSVKEFSEAGKKDKNPITRALKMSVWLAFGPMIRLGNWLLNGIGVTLDIIGAPFRYAIELIRFGLMLALGDTKGIQEQRKNLAKFDARVRDGIREHFAGFLGPLFRIIGKKDWADGIEKQGSWGSLFGEEGTKGMGYAGGGKTGPIKRTLTRKKKPRSLSFTPRRITPGSSIGGEDKVQQIFPNPNKSTSQKQWWDPLGVFTGKDGQNKPEDQKGKQKSSSPNSQEFLISSNNILGKSNFFGPFFTVALKTVLGQRPDNLDYKNIGKGLNSWMQTIFKPGSIGFAGGGSVDASEFFGGEDYSNVISDTVKESVSKQIDSTIRELSKDLSLGAVGREEMIQDNIQRGQEGSEEEQNGSLGTSGAPNAPKNAHPGWAKIYELARKAGDPFPEVTASQWAIESGYGKYKTGKNNPFGQTGTHPKYGGTTLATPRDPGGGSKTFMNFGSIEEAVAYRVKKWVPQYKNAKTPREALMMIQKYGGRGRYAQGWPTRQFPEGDWMGYVRSVEGIIKDNGGSPLRARTSGMAPSLMAGQNERGAPGTVGGTGKFIQGNSGNSRGVHFHIGPGSQTKGTILQSQYNADARASASKVIDYFLKRGSTVYDGRRGTYYKSGNEVAAAQRAHSASGSQGGIDLQVDFEKPAKFPLNVMGMAYRPNGFGVSADIVGSNSFVAHGRYDEKGRKAPQTGGLIVYEKGGKTLNKPHIAMLGEKGREFVIDADSTAAVEGTFPGFLDAINKAKYDDAIQVLRNFVSYEQPYGGPPEVIIQEKIVPVPVSIPSNTTVIMSSGLHSKGSSNPITDSFEIY